MIGVRTKPGFTTVRMRHWLLIVVLVGVWMGWGRGQEYDITQWTTVSVPTTEDILHVVIARDESFALVRVAVDAAGYILRSSDGLTWTRDAAPSLPSNLADFTYWYRNSSDFGFVAVSPGKVHTSPYGVSWTDITLSSESHSTAFSHVTAISGNVTGRIWILAAGRDIWRSTDQGANWTQSTLATTADGPITGLHGFYSGSAGINQFVAVAHDDIFWSVDGSLWEAHPNNGAFPNLESVGFFQGLGSWLVAGDGTWWFSQDESTPANRGEMWTRGYADVGASMPGTDYQAIAAGTLSDRATRVWVAAGGNGTLAYSDSSTPGRTWKPATLIGDFAGATIRDIAVTGFPSQFVAVLNGGGIAYPRIILEPDTLSATDASMQNQQAALGTRVDVDPSFVVLAANDNPIQGETVSFAVTGGGTVSPTTATTDANGRVTVAWTLGNTPGTNTLTATVDGTSPSVTTTLTATAVFGAPTNLAATPGDASATVTFTAPSGSGITNYEVSLDSGATWTPLSPADASSPITVTGLQNGVAASIQLRATNGTLSGFSSSSISVTPQASTSDETPSPGGPDEDETPSPGDPDEDETLTESDPEPEESVRVYPSDGRIVIRFDPPAAGVTDVSYSIDGGTSWTRNDDLASPIIIDTVDNDQTYDVKVRFDADGEVLAETEAERVTPEEGAITPPLTLDVLPGEDGLWIVFDPAIGSVGGYEYQALSDTDAVTNETPWVPVETEVAEEGVRVQVPVEDEGTSARVRGVGENGEPGPATDWVEVIASERPQPAISFTPPKGILNVPSDGTSGEFAFLIVIENLGTTNLENLWLIPSGVPAGTTIIGMEPTSGHGWIHEYDGSWFWRQANLAAGQEVEIEITVRVQEDR